MALCVGVDDRNKMLCLKDVGWDLLGALGAGCCWKMSVFGLDTISTLQNGCYLSKKIKLFNQSLIRFICTTTSILCNTLVTYQFMDVYPMLSAHLISIRYIEISYSTKVGLTLHITEPQHKWKLVWKRFLFWYRIHKKPNNPSLSAKHTSFWELRWKFYELK